MFAAVAFLLLQLFAVAREHLGPTRYFAWVPNDYAVEYSLRVETRGRALTPVEIASRYGRPIRRVSPDFASEPGFKSLYEAPAAQLLAEAVSPIPWT